MEPMAVALRSSRDVRAIKVGTIQETLALYADDMLLFLNDPGDSLRAVLDILNKFALFSGLKVNWSKSSILPLDVKAKEGANPNIQLQWVESIKYLWVKITAKVQDYYSLNLLPLITLLKQKVQAWTKLPLSMMGRISLLKMKILPVIYFLRHAPVWIPKSYFRQIDSIVGSFLWAPKPPRIGLKVLQEPSDQGLPGNSDQGIWHYQIGISIIWQGKWCSHVDGLCRMMGMLPQS